MSSRFVFALCVLVVGGAAFAQSERGNTPPGMSQDGSKPADGAIVGGSIKPGERGGSPDKDPSPRAKERCDELSGTLRDQCLEQVKRDSASGGTRSPTPPPQNPPRLPAPVAD